MTDAECVALLQWCLPRLGLRWPGYRRVRRQVCKRIGRRIQALGLDETTAYRTYLTTHPDEWSLLDTLCRISISRFYRDRRVFDQLEAELLPSLARLAMVRGDGELRVWVAGCASGEEAFTLAILWHLQVQSLFPGLPLALTATDADATLLRRARRGCYRKSSLKDVPSHWLDTAFQRDGDTWCVRDELRRPVHFLQQDIRDAWPQGPFHLALCRNLAFTYFDLEHQRLVLGQLLERLIPGGYLVVGHHETLPEKAAHLQPLQGETELFLRLDPTLHHL